MEALIDQSTADTADLVLRSRQKDAEAFTALIRRYDRVALSVAYSVVGNADAAGDIVQDAFLRAWERLGDLQEPARFATWLCGICRNLAIDSHRRGRHMKSAIDVTNAQAPAMVGDRVAGSPLDELDRREQNHRVAEALQSLDEATRSVIILRYYDGLSSKEIGQILEISPAAVDMRLSRGRQQLKKLLETEVVSEK